MANRLSELDLEEAAQSIVGNWKHFQCFVWYRDDIPDADNWAIIYTHNRDSGLLDLSNAGGINKALEPFTDGDDPDEIENRDDQGGYPSEASLRAAFEALGFPQVETAC